MKVLHAVLAAALLAPAAFAKPNINIKINDKDAIPGPITVPAGTTREGDMVVKGSVTINGTLIGDLAVLEGPVTVNGRLRGDLASLGGSVSVNGEVEGDLATAGGPVSVKGILRGDIATAGGPVDVQGIVTGSVASMGGVLTLGPKSTLGGDAALLGGSLEKAPGAKFTGDLSQFDWKAGRDLFRMASKLGREMETPEAKERKRKAKLAASIAFHLGAWFLVALVGALLPRSVEAVAGSIRADLWRTAGWGLLLCLAFAPAILLMTVSVIGIPLIPLAFLAAVAAKLLGFAAFARVLADRVAASLDRPVPPTLAGVALGYLVLISPLLAGKLLSLAGAGGLGGILVFLNLILLSFGAIAGLGGVFQTRFGTRK